MKPVFKMPTVGKLKDMRWIGEGENLQKWYIKSSMPKISKQLGEGDPQTHGLKGRKRAEETMGVVVELIRDITKWGGKMVVVEGDVEAAFGQMRTEKLVEVLKRRGVDGYNIGAVHREMVGTRVELIIPGVEKRNLTT